MLNKSLQLDIDAVLIKSPDVSAKGVKLIVLETVQHFIEVLFLVLKGKIELDTTTENTDQHGHAKNINQNAMEEWVAAKHANHENVPGSSKPVKFLLPKKKFRLKRPSNQSKKQYFLQN